MKIKTTYAGNPNITPGKAYEVERVDMNLHHITDDAGNAVPAFLADNDTPCHSLDLVGTWEVVNTTRDQLKAIADRWGINYSTIETVAKMAAARLRREGLPATEENASQALQEANALCLEMSQRMLDNPQASARAIRQQLEQNRGWKSQTA